MHIVQPKHVSRLIREAAPLELDLKSFLFFYKQVAPLEHIATQTYKVLSEWIPLEETL